MKERNVYILTARAKQESAVADEESRLAEAARLADAGRPDKALSVLSAGNTNTDAARNGRGVCLLRLGRADDAVRVFRSLVFPSGCTWMRPELPVIYRTNLCTALLLAGHPAGCANLLSEMIEQNHRSVVRLRDAIARWQRELSWWQWLQWKVGLEPAVSVRLDFPAGEFAEPAAVITPKPPRKPSLPPSSPQAA